jgi:hypothetical protein
VSGYSPIRSEIDPAPLMRKLAAQGARLALPAVMARGKSLAFRIWSPNDRLMLGPLGILEPSPAAAEVVPDIMLVPLAAFDRWATASAMAPALRLHPGAFAQTEAITAIGARLRGAGNRGGTGAAARRGAGLCANGNRTFDFRS